MSPSSDLPNRPAPSRALLFYARFVVFATFCLIFLGGLVTTKDAGMAVPDWPLSFGSVNPHGWWDMPQVRLEHGHRLYASTVGLLVVGLAVALWRSRPQLRWWGLAAVVLVCLQGYLGGRRVLDKSLNLAIIHGCTAQAFLCLLVFIAVSLSPFWQNPPRPGASTRSIWKGALALTLLVYLQLIVGAVMRHYKAGLAIPDFPLAFGRLVPNLQAWAVQIAFTHRVGAFLILLGTLVLVSQILFAEKPEPSLARPAWLLLSLVFLQIALGASIIWTKRDTIPTTFHVINGAAVLASALLITLRARRLTTPTPTAATALASLQTAS